jgi:hypothetical protein
MKKAFLFFTILTMGLLLFGCPSGKTPKGGVSTVTPGPGLPQYRSHCICATTMTWMPAGNQQYQKQYGPGKYNVAKAEAEWMREANGAFDKRVGCTSHGFGTCYSKEHNVWTGTDTYTVCCV